MTPLERQLLNDFQRDFPLTPTPFADMAQQLGVSEAVVLEGLQQLQADGAVSRVGPVFQTGTIGASTLAAMAVPTERLEAVAQLVNDYPQVNHNYEREHAFNLWFVVTAASDAELQAVLQDIEQRTALAVMSLPMLSAYHIDLGFDLQWR